MSTQAHCVPAAWLAEIDRRVAAAIDAHHLEIGEGIAEIRAKLRTQLRDEIAAAVGELRAELTVQRAAEKADVVTLPALPLRRRSDVA